MAKNKFIDLNIADRRYPLGIDPSEEEEILKASKIINDKILSYRKMFTGRDDQDFLAMAAIDLAKQLLELRKEKDIDPS